MMKVLHQRRSIKNAFARLKDATIGESMEECALGMGERSHANYAALKDAQTMLKTEECA